jgi:protein-tyrosine phosphatase
MAEVVLRDQVAKAGLAGRVTVDSAGTGDWHVGGPMNDQARLQLGRSGYDGEAHRARQINPSWLSERDLVLAMDTANLRDLLAMAPADEASRIRLFGEVAGLDGAEVPDPYYGTEADFARVLAMLETGMARVAAQLQEVTEVPAS